MNLLVAICLIVLSFCLGFTFGIHVIRSIIRKTISRLAQSAGMSVEDYNTRIDSIAANINTVKVDIPEIDHDITLTTETHGDTIFAYDTKTDNFVCQGSSLEELASNCRLFNNISRAIVFHEEQIFYFLDGLPVKKA